MNLLFNHSKVSLVFLTIVFLLLCGCTDTIPNTTGEPDSNNSRIANHKSANMLRLGKIPESAIQDAKDSLHIGYGHTSHGRQITEGMSGLIDFANLGGIGSTYSENLFTWNSGGVNGALDLRDNGDGYLPGDLGDSSWVENTRDFLTQYECNVIIWSWCGQVSSISEQGLIDHYLAPMNQLEHDYPLVTFVYMTGHLDGRGETGNLHLRNEQIRTYCKANDKWLYDFADIESYDPDGNYYLDRYANDGCWYDYDSDGPVLDENGDGFPDDQDDRNWAEAWQNSHTEGEDWYSCNSPHSQPLNANMKAYAAWWMWSRIAGWNEDIQNK